MTPLKALSITRPEDCVAGCSYPLSEADFLRLLHNGPPGNYVRFLYERDTKMLNDQAIWEKYAGFASKLAGHLQFIENNGVRVIYGFGAADFGQISGYSVFTLMAHYSKSGDEVSLFDGIANKTSFPGLIPAGFNGILDMSVCNAVIIRDELKRVMSNQVIAYDVVVPILQSLLVYKQVIRNLRRHQMNYIDCFVATISDLIKNDHE
ncbi:hypothetical protein [Mucilaginibacter flavus]|uniref:hypothetical protein n=1 Tax=Mucilaginibacter flavus TaxID=931504 RepID=UPI0025B36300|nr:hypothetical protein [Mucilaginibacter flavus]